LDYASALAQELAMSKMHLKSFVAATLLAVFTYGDDVSAIGVPGFPSLYQSKVTKGCTGTPCIAPFASVPANRVLQATHVNCFGQASGSSFVALALITSIEDQFNLFFAQQDDQNRFSINETILSFFQADTRPRIQLFTSNNPATTLTCILTGTLLTPP
jgi:hypothetical protein